MIKSIISHNCLDYCLYPATHCLIVLINSYNYDLFNVLYGRLSVPPASVNWIYIEPLLRHLWASVSSFLICPQDAR
jgi:hypothetical protein